MSSLPIWVASLLANSPQSTRRRNQLDRPERSEHRPVFSCFFGWQTPDCAPHLSARCIIRINRLRHGLDNAPATRAGWLFWSWPVPSSSVIRGFGVGRRQSVSGGFTRLPPTYARDHLQSLPNKPPVGNRGHRRGSLEPFSLSPWKRGATTLTIFSINNRSWRPDYLSRDLPRELRKIGLPAGLNIHGLRKLAATRLAQAGCSPHEIQAITGHKTLAMVQHYTKAVSQRTLADGGSPDRGHRHRHDAARHPRRRGREHVGDQWRACRSLKRSNGVPVILRGCSTTVARHCATWRR